jgi:hypothetical protein
LYTQLAVLFKHLLQFLLELHGYFFSHFRDRCWWIVDLDDVEFTHGCYYCWEFIDCYVDCWLQICFGSIDSTSRIIFTSFFN